MSMTPYCGGLCPYNNSIVPIIIVWNTNCGLYNAAVWILTAQQEFHKPTSGYIGNIFSE